MVKPVGSAKIMCSDRKEELAKKFPTPMGPPTFDHPGPVKDPMDIQFMNTKLELDGQQILARRIEKNHNRRVKKKMASWMEIL